MNKSQLIDALADRFEGSRKDAAHALDAVLDTITRQVAKGEKVAITGFGSFEKAVRNARWVRNPQTGDVGIPANSDLVFEIELLDFKSRAEVEEQMRQMQMMQQLQQQMQGRQGGQAAPPPPPQ